MLEVRDVFFSYGKHEVLKGVSFSAASGECIGILGNNGAGKSTLITCINRIRNPASGMIRINGSSVSEMSRNQIARSIAYVAQKNEMSHSTVFDCVLLGRKPYIKWGMSEADLEICRNVIDLVGLKEMELRPLEELSGGEIQKVMLARALVQEPQILLLDEPTSNLDPKNQHEMLALVRKAAKDRNMTVLIVIHDLNLALRYCDSVLFMKDGVNYHQGGIETVTDDVISEVYGVQAQVMTVKDRKVVVIE